MTLGDGFRSEEVAACGHVLASPDRVRPTQERLSANAQGNPPCPENEACCSEHPLPSSVLA
jgi:hypothetical protein